MRTLLLLLLLCTAHAQQSAPLDCFSFCFCAFSPVQRPGSPFRRSFREAALVVKAKVLRIVSPPVILSKPRAPRGPACNPCLPPGAPPASRRLSARALLRLSLPCCPPCPPVEGTVVYQVKVRKVFKGAAGKKVLVSSPADLKARCGIRLQVGTVYVLMAAAGTPWKVSQCLVSKEWRTVSKQDRKFLKSCSGSNPDDECTRDPLL